MVTTYSRLPPFTPDPNIKFGHGPALHILRSISRYSSISCAWSERSAALEGVSSNLIHHLIFLSPHSRATLAGWLAGWVCKYYVECARADCGVVGGSGYGGTLGDICIYIPISVARRVCVIWRSRRPSRGGIRGGWYNPPNMVGGSGKKMDWEGNG